MVVGPKRRIAKAVTGPCYTLSDNGKRIFDRRHGVARDLLLCRADEVRSVADHRPCPRQLRLQRFELECQCLNLLQEPLDERERA